MELSADFKTVKDDVEVSLKRLKNYSDNNKVKAMLVAVFSGVVSAATTVLIGLTSIFESVETTFRVLSLITSGSLTVVIAWDTLFSHKKLWLLQAEGVQNLYELQDDIRHLEAAGGATQEQTNALYQRYRQIHRSMNREWRELRSSE